MDPISFVLSTYINAVSVFPADRYSEVLGTEIQATTVEYNGRKIPYAYQRWKIKPDSVCAIYKGDINTYSSCTVDAKAMFTEICGYLQQNPQRHWKYKKNKNMYCSASLSYKPLIAKIEKASQPTEVETARKECNLAISANMGNSSPKTRNEIDIACAKYKEMSE